MRQRAVGCIASAHGTLQELVYNQELNGLVGGIMTVPIGDKAAAERQKRHGGELSKMLTNRYRPPVSMSFFEEFCFYSPPRPVFFPTRSKCRFRLKSLRFSIYALPCFLYLLQAQKCFQGVFFSAIFSGLTCEKKTSIRPPNEWN